MESQIAGLTPLLCLLIKLLPRKKQQLIVEFLDAIISTEKA